MTEEFDFADLIDGEPLPARLRAGAVWHYTTADGLLGILSSNHLWASAPQVLNDSSEVLYGVELVREVLDELESTVLPPAFHPYFRRVVDESWVAAIQSSCFVISASTENDLLNQWRYYANADGFALGFDTSGSWGTRSVVSSVGGRTPVPTIFTPVVPGWHAVEYDRQAQRRSARNALLFGTIKPPTASDNWLEDSDEWDKIVGHTRLLLNTVPLTVKHPAFSDEREVRYIGGASNNQVRFRTAGGRIVPYTTVAALDRQDTPDEPDRQFPLLEVMCGPGCRPGTTDIVARALEHHGFADVRVKTSDAPLSL